MKIVFDNNTMDIIEESYKYYKRYRRYYDNTKAMDYALFYSICINDIDPLSKNILKTAKIRPSIKNWIKAHTKERENIYIHKDSYLKEIKQKIKSIIDYKIVEKKLNYFLISPIDYSI